MGVNYDLQRAALAHAWTMLKELPPGHVWSVCVTEDDGPENPSVMNLFTETDKDWPYLKSLLNLSNPIDEGETFQTFRVGILAISLILKEQPHDD